MSATTGATLPLGREFGWISMIIVTAGARHRGLAAQLADVATRHIVAGLGGSPEAQAEVEAK